MIRVIIATIALWEFSTTADLYAMDFTLAERTIRAAGQIQEGDADRLTALVRRDQLNSEDNYVVRLNSTGGLLLEGLRLGTAIRDMALETLVARGDECASACALAFLGGTERHATGTGVARRLEVGGVLGFHGFRGSKDTVRLYNETLSDARIVTGLVLTYAAGMKDLDLGWLARSLNVEPDDLIYVRRPRDITALGIMLEGMPNAIPQSWSSNACRFAIRDLTPILDSGERVSTRNAPIPSIIALRNMIVSTRFNPGIISDFIKTLSDSDAIDLALGSPFYLNERKPIFGAASVDLDRGAGFYYDKCIVVRTKRDLSVIVANVTGHTLRYKYISGPNFLLAMYDQDAPLW